MLYPLSYERRWWTDELRQCRRNRGRWTLIPQLSPRQRHRDARECPVGGCQSRSCDERLCPISRLNGPSVTRQRFGTRVGTASRPGAAPGEFLRSTKRQRVCRAGSSALGSATTRDRSPSTRKLSGSPTMAPPGLPTMRSSLLTDCPARRSAFLTHDLERLARFEHLVEQAIDVSA